MPLLSRIEGCEPLRPVHAAVASTAAMDKIATEVAIQLKVVSRRDPDLVIVLWDREQSDQCPGGLARDLYDQILQQSQATYSLRVVFMDRMFENWLIAALPTLRGLQTRFRLSKADVGSICPNKADQVDALALIKKSVTHDQYEKALDAKRIPAGANVDEMAAHSRGFRRFLDCLRHPAYLHQSRSPRRP
ncbi:MAG: DUF4276 family protein [Chloroflexota bacterium]|nr:DUF4276 family protein [Chloroflexota bacterium]